MRDKYIERYITYVSNAINKYVPENGTTISVQDGNVVISVWDTTETIVEPSKYGLLTFLSWEIVGKIERMHRANGNEQVGKKIVDLFIG